MNVLQEAQKVDARDLEEELENKALRKQEERRCFRVGCCLITVSLLVVIAVSLGVGLTRQKSDMVSLSPTMSPSMAPSSVPSSAPTSHLDLLYDYLPETTKMNLRNSSTPQWKAFGWLSHHQNITRLPEWRKKQIFALATFFYSFEGENWNPKIRERWMDDTTEECLWFSSGYGCFCNGDYEEHSIEGNGLAKIDSCNSLGEFTWLELQDLKLSGFTTSIPPEISFLTSLNGLGIFQSDIAAPLKDMLPAELYQMTHLTILDYSSQFLHGLLPSELGLLRELTDLGLHANSINGLLPSELGSLTKLTSLWLDGNSLTGMLPSELGSMTGVAYLDLGLNYFSGSLASEVGRMTNLTSLWLDDNSLTGLLPTELGLMTSLAELDMYHNFLSGPIPSELGRLTLLEWLALGNLTMMTGLLPSELALLTLLHHLDLRGSTGLSGKIPDKLCYLQDPSCTSERSVWDTSNCSLLFDCTDILCGCDCPCSNSSFGL